MAMASIGKHVQPAPKANDRFCLTCHHWPVGLMDKALAPGAGDSRFESWADHWASALQGACPRLLAGQVSCGLGVDTDLLI